MAWTIVRPTVLMETWAMVAGEPMLKKGKALIFGRGENPINFVSAQDVAQFVEMAVVDPDLRGVAIDVGGPENLTLNQFVETFAAMTGRAGRKTHIPLAAMRLMAVMMKPLSPALARIVHSAVVMDTATALSTPARPRTPFPRSDSPRSRSSQTVTTGAEPPDGRVLLEPRRRPAQWMLDAYRSRAAAPPIPLRGLTDVVRRDFRSG